MISLQDVADDLYRIVVAERKSQSPNRLAMLADLCIEELAERGLRGAVKERTVPGIGASYVRFELNGGSR